MSDQRFYALRARQRGLLGAVALGTAAMILTGRGGPPIVFILVVVATFIAFAGLIVSVAQIPALGRRALVITAVALIGLAVAAPVRSSRDLWAYVMFGRMVAVHHVSPYTHTPSEFPDDPMLSRMQPQFRTAGSVYGPLWTLVSAGDARICEASPLCNRWFFQLVEAIAVLAAALIVWRATADVAATAFVALNPLLIVSVVNGGHPDGLLASMLLAGVLVARRRPEFAGLLFGAAVLIKINAVLVVAIVLLWLWLRGGRAIAARTAGIAGAISLAGYLLAGGMRALKPLETQAGVISKHSFWETPKAFLERHGWTSLGAAHLVGHGGLIAVITLAIVLVFAAIRSKPLPSLTAIALAAYVLGSPYVLPWYAAGLIVFLAFEVRARWTWVLVGYTSLLYVAYPAHVTKGFDGSWLPFLARDILPVVQLVLLAGLAATWLRSRSDDLADSAVSVRT